jgi:DNA polymerase-3 subunit alpha
MKQQYVNIHTHTTYSLQDGMGQVSEILDLAKAKGFKAHAFTDHGNLFHVADAQLWQKKNPDFKVIHGCEFYLREDVDFINTQREALEKLVKEKLLTKEQIAAERKKLRQYFHLILLAKNETGLEGLFELNQFAWKHGRYYKPCIDMKRLRENEKIRGNVVATSACLAGQLAQIVLGKYDKHIETLYKEFKKIFKNDYYLEVQINEIADQAKVNNALIDLDKDRIVFSNDNHYLCENHAKTHSILLNLQIGKMPNEKITDEQAAQSGVAWEFEAKHLYLKDTSQIFRQRDIWQKNLKNNVLEKALQNTLEIEAKIDVIQLNDKPKIYQIYGVDDGFETLKKKCYAKLKKTQHAKDPVYIKRLEHELAVIKQKKFYDYFLLVEKFIELANDNEITVGVGRGSAGGSLVNYLLGITGLDPIKYGLFFERFLDYERNDFPDIDIDFDDNNKIKELIRDYVGRDNFALISTFGTFNLNSLFRDVCRAFSVPLEIVDQFAKVLEAEQKRYRRDNNIPPVEKIEKDALLKIYADVAKMTGFSKRYPEINEHIDVLLNQYKYLGTHAGGIVVYDDLYKKMPVVFVDGEQQTGFPESGTHAILSKFGWVKFDILGVKTLKYKNAVSKYLQRDITDEISPDKFPFDDKKVFRIFQKGLTLGIFQFEGRGITEFARKVKPESFEEVSDISAIYRPAPLSAKLDEMYLENKRANKASYIHPKLKNILGYSKGVLVYQEQLMQICHELGGISLADTNLVRKAISKAQNNDAIVAMKKTMFAGFAKNGLSTEKSNRLWEYLAKFGGYCFNKSHSYAYSFISLQTAYMKAHYPAQFYAAYIAHEPVEKIAAIASEMQHFGLKLKLPILSKFDEHVMIDGDALYLGLTNVKGIGELAAREIKRVDKIKKLKTLKDFFDNEHMDYRVVNFEVQKILIQFGFFDEITTDRNLLIQWLTYYLRSVKQATYSTNDFSLKLMRENTKLAKINHANNEAVAAVKAEYKKKHNGDRIWQKKFKADYPDVSVIYANAAVVDAQIPSMTDNEKCRLEIDLVGYTERDMWEALGYADEKRRLCERNARFTADFNDLEPGAAPIFIFLLKSIRYAKDKRGNKMAFMECADKTGHTEVIPIFASDLKEIKADLTPGLLYKTKFKRNTGQYSGFMLAISKIAAIKK